MLNYFTTLELARRERAPWSSSARRRRSSTAIAEIDADVVGLIEIENNGDDARGDARRRTERTTSAEVRTTYIPTGELGTDVITTALIYKPADGRAARA